MKKSIYFACFSLLSGMLLTGCQESYENVSDHNSIWNEKLDPMELILLDGSTESATKNFSVTLAQPVDYQINVKYAAAPDKVNEYNAIYNDNAVLLPSSYYTLTTSDVTIKAGAITSSTGQIDFQNLKELDSSKTYVIPVEIVSANIDLLASRSVSYYVVRGAALINVVGDMTGTCLKFINEGQTPMLANLTQFTVECLVYPYAFENQLSTLIGIEDHFLIRIGDTGIEKNQIQLSCMDYIKISNSEWLVDTDKWTFLTIAVDLDAKTANVYFNGRLKGSTETIDLPQPVNWDVESFDRACYIGYSYQPGRDFQGNMSEMRVWNKVLTPADLAQPNHFYHVEPDADGLVAYWKFNEGAGNIVHDYANGYDMIVPSIWPDTGENSTVPGNIGWVNVSLPQE